MNKIMRKSAGVKFESDVLTFVDHVAAHQQRSRSFVINQMVRWHMKHVDEQQKVGVKEELPVIQA